MKILYKILGVAAFFFAFAASTHAASLTLSPASRTVNVGDTFSVDVMLDTQGAAIDGVDLKYLNYNPYNLQLQDGDAATSGTQVAAGSLMPNTLANSVDTTNGRVTFSQVTNGGSKYTGSGRLATVTFRALVAGNVSVTFNHTSGSTVDSNVASLGADVLTSVVNGNYIINGTSGSVTTAPAGSGGTQGTGATQPSSGASSNLRLINDNGTYYLIINNILHGITNPGMLTSYGFTFAMGKPATNADRQLPKGSLLTPGDGSLVKSQEDPTVYLISGQQRYGFVSEAVFLGLGFKFSSVLVVTNPELQLLPRASNLDDSKKAHLAGLDIIRNGTVYWIGGDNKLYGYPTMEVYNSWHIPNDFSRVVPANDADMSLPMGTVVEKRILE